MPAPYSNTVAEGSAAIARGMNDSSTTGRSPMLEDPVVHAVDDREVQRAVVPDHARGRRGRSRGRAPASRRARSRASRSASSNSSPMPSPPAGEPAGSSSCDSRSEPIMCHTRCSRPPSPAASTTARSGAAGSAHRPRPHRGGQLSRAVLLPCHGGDRVPALRARLAGGVGVGRAGSGEHVHPAVVDDLPRPVGRRRAERAVPDRPFDARPAQGHLAGPRERLHAPRRREAARPLGRRLPLVAAAPDARLPIGSRVEPAHRAPSPAVNCSMASSGLTRRSSRGAR